MICPQCLKSIPDDAEFCPHCSAYVGDRVNLTPASEFVFCDGCGARLTGRERTCPKCGRPAPGILSTDSASAALAAGHTASFPRLTQELIDARAKPSNHESVHAALESVNVPVIEPDFADPSATNVLRAGDIARAAVEKKGKGAAAVDPYHKPRKRWPKVMGAIAALLALAGGAVYFVTEDPLGVMPGLYAEFQRSAREMFPVREGMAPAGSATDSTSAEPQEESVLTEEQAYQKLTAAYNTIVAQHDALDQIINDYNTWFVRKNLDERKAGSQSAYSARKTLDTVIEELQGLKLAEGSQYASQAANLVQLAQWVRTRVDIYCNSWDISLSIVGDSPSSHQDEILAPLNNRRAEDQEAQAQFYAHEQEYRPVSPVA